MGTGTLTAEPPLESTGIAEAQTWEPRLVEKLYDLLRDAELENPVLEAALETLHEEYGDAAYAELIYLLSHLRFETAEAKRHWREVLAHRDRLQAAQGSPIDLRVALVSYFVQVDRKLENPMVIEMQLFEKTRDSAYRDELTGLYNYRIFREYLQQEIARSGRGGSPLSLVMIDVDDFKHYNDTNGHEAGNETLEAVARILQGTVQEVGFPARYGGEEFALVLPLTSKTDARAVAERAREAIEEYTFSHEENQPKGRVTVSVGIATYPADAADATELVRCADRAMYVSKAQGKNQVQLYGQSRRSHSRVETTLRGNFRMLATKSYPVTTRNISEAGMLFLIEQPPAVGSMIEFELALRDSQQNQIRAAGRVVHVYPREGGSYPTAVRLTDISDADRRLLTDCIRRLGAGWSTTG